MGSTLSADVFYGFNLGYGEDIDDDEMPEWWQNDEEWQEVLATRLGWVEVPHPTHLYPPECEDHRTSYEERERMRAEVRKTPEFQAWSDSRDELHALVSSVGVEIDHYGWEYGASAVRVKASVRTFYSAVDVLKPLVVGEDWADRVTRFCELLELPIPDDGPSWSLNCSYG